MYDFFGYCKNCKNENSPISAILTAFGCVVDEDDSLHEHLGALDARVQRPEKGRPGLVVEHYNNGGRRQHFCATVSLQTRPASVCSHVGQRAIERNPRGSEHIEAVNAEEAARTPSIARVEHYRIAVLAGTGIGSEVKLVEFVCVRNVAYLKKTKVGKHLWAIYLGNILAEHAVPEREIE